MKSVSGQPLPGPFAAARAYLSSLIATFCGFFMGRPFALKRRDGSLVGK